MTDDVDQTTKPNDRSKPLAVTGRLKRAIELMIWHGHSRDEAATAAGLKPKSLYNAFRKHHVKQYFRAELGALRESARAKNFHHLEKIAADSENDMAKVAAIKTMEQISEEEARRMPASGNVSLPGLTIQIINAPAPALPSRFPDGHQLTIDHDETHDKTGKTALLRGDGPHE
jgi:hypothetical protein